MRAYKLILFFLLTLTVMKAHAQNITTTSLTWTSANTMKPSTAEIISEATTFVTYTNDSIRWIGQDGAVKYKFKILEANGTWTDVSQPGSIIYKVDSNGNRGVVYMERDVAIKVRMMINTEAEPVVYELAINSIKKL